MNWADWAILAIIGISSLISVARGFVKEAISLAVWFVAFFIALAFQDPLATLLQHQIESVSLRYIIAFAILFIATLMVGAMVKHLLGEFIKVTGLRGFDRLLGIGFGVLRGCIIVMAILILMPTIIPVGQEVWWQQSLLIPELLLFEQWCKESFTIVIGWLKQLLP